MLLLLGSYILLPFYSLIVVNIVSPWFNELTLPDELCITVEPGVNVLSYIPPDIVPPFNVVTIDPEY